MDAFLQVDEGDVKSEDVAREAGDVAKTVTGVCNGKDPVEDQSPSTSVSRDPKAESGNIHPNPAHEGEVVRAAWCYDVVYRVVEDRDGA